MAEEKLTFRKLIEMELVNDDTFIVFRDKQLLPIAMGNWFNDNILSFMDYIIEDFTWQDDNRLYICTKP